MLLLLPGVSGGSLDPHGRVRRAAGALERGRYQENQPRSGYHLTKTAGGLLTVLQALQQWVVEAPPVRS